MTGSYISHYHIVAKVAEGGMGVVYKAEDTRLERTVALKFLSLRSLSSEDDRNRFLQEARAAARLDHPNIATIHEIDEVQGQTFIAMAFVDGPSVAQKLSHGRLEFAEAIDIALQTAEALGEAHENGVVHRDVKSANVMLTRRGQVKLTDFGLARLTSQRISAVHSLQGTPAYMAPEQIQGENIDHRSDLWSLGVMLYEMLTGQMPFQGDYRQVLAYAITNEEPRPIEALRPEVPAELRAVISKALQKDPEHRYQSADEFIGDLKQLRSQFGQPAPAVISTGAHPTLPEQRSRGVVAGVLGVVAVTALGAIGWFALRQPTPAAPPQITPITSYEGREEFPSFSPDGNKIVFAWNGEHQDNFDIYVKVVDSGAPLRLTSDFASDMSPAWSPDGRQIAFLREITSDSAELFVVPPLGGTERQLVRVAAPASWGLGWSRDSRFIAVADRKASDGPIGISLIDAASGEKKWLASAPPGASRVLFPSFSPDGRTLAFEVERGAWLGDTYVVDAADGEPRRLTVDSGQSEGLAWSPDGSYLLAARIPRMGRRVCWRIPFPVGKPELLSLGDNPTQPAFSTRPSRWAFSKRISQYDLRLIDTASPHAAPMAFASSTQLDANPQFSPDGQHVAFSSNRTGGLEIWTAYQDGSRPFQLTSLEITGSPRWSPDGTRIAFDVVAEGNADVYVLDVAGGAPRRVTTSPFEDVLPGWSADGQSLYFTSNRSGQAEIWKMSLGGPESDATQITHKGGFYAVESPDGQWLYYSKERALETTIWKVPIQGGDESQLIEETLAGWGNLVANSRGLYFTHRKEGIAQEPRWVVLFVPAEQLQPHTAATEGKPGGVAPLELAELPRFPTLGGPGLTVSPDGRWIIAGQIDIASDLMLVESQR